MSDIGSDEYDEEQGTYLGVSRPAFVFSNSTFAVRRVVHSESDSSEAVDGHDDGIMDVD